MTNICCHPTAAQRSPFGSAGGAALLSLRNSPDAGSRMAFAQRPLLLTETKQLLPAGRSGALGSTFKSCVRRGWLQWGQGDTERYNLRWLWGGQPRQHPKVWHPAALPCTGVMGRGAGGGTWTGQQMDPGNLLVLENVSEDPSTAPTPGISERCCEQELCVQPGTGERWTRLLSQSLLSSTLSFKAFSCCCQQGSGACTGLSASVCCPGVELINIRS